MDIAHAVRCAPKIQISAARGNRPLRGQLPDRLAQSPHHPGIWRVSTSGLPAKTRADPLTIAAAAHKSSRRFATSGWTRVRDDDATSQITVATALVTAPRGASMRKASRRRIAIGAIDRRLSDSAPAAH